MAAQKTGSRGTADTFFTQWLAYVERFGKAYDFGRRIDPVAGVTPPNPEPLPTEKCHEVLICSPHPDDEALTGGLALRLAAGGATVLNLAITLGSRPERKKARLHELEAACHRLGFACRPVCEPLAFNRLPAHNRRKVSPEWEQQMDILTAHLDREQPKLVLFPHASDKHPTHIAVHHLAMAAVIRHSTKNCRKLLIAETEFWHPLSTPNLLLGLRPEEVATLIAAITCHHGEITRHPYHLRLPARLMDNVRRFTESDEYGRAAIDLLFGETYHLAVADRGCLQQPAQSTVIQPETKLSLADLNSLCNIR